MLCGDQLVSDCAFSEAISYSLMMTELLKHVGVF